MPDFSADPAFSAATKGLIAGYRQSCSTILPSRRAR